MYYTDSKVYKPVPVQAILGVITSMLAKGVGEEFDLEIYERPYYNDDSYNAVTIELKFRIPAPEHKPEKQPAFSA